MRIDRWLELKRTKVFCLALATLFAAEQTVWGADVNVLHTLQFSGEQQRQADVARTAAVLTVYDDLYGRAPTEQELKEALEFLRRSPQMAHLIERLSQSPESRWRLRQLNPERIARRKAEAARISDAASRIVGAFLRDLVTQDTGRKTPDATDGAESETLHPESGIRHPASGIRHPESSYLQPITITPNLTVQPDPAVLAELTDSRITELEQWLADPQTLCSNCAPNALAPMLGMVGIPASRETLTAQAFLVDYLTGNLHLGQRTQDT